MSYAEKLKDPRWQKKRLYILERDGWACQTCGETRRNLQVHHLFYARRDPWDYPDEAYQTLCDQCHEFRQTVVDSYIERFRVSLRQVENVNLQSHLRQRLFPEQRESMTRFVEGKPLRFYLAGKIAPNDWRHTIVTDLRNHCPNGACGDGVYEPFPEIVPESIFGHHHYVGPFFVSCDHGCFHGPNRHGSDCNSERSNHDSLGIHPLVRERALRGIQNCDVLFAYINSTDCYGTLFEIGYANALGKPVFIALEKEFPDLWFCLHPHEGVFQIGRAHV